MSLLSFFLLVFLSACTHNFDLPVIPNKKHMSLSEINDRVIENSIVEDEFYDFSKQKKSRNLTQKAFTTFKNPLRVFLNDFQTPEGDFYDAVYVSINSNKRCE